MRRFVHLIGVLVLLIAVKTDANKERNTKNFLDWGNDNDAPAVPATGDDFTLEDLDKESSGDDNTHTDDEDFDVSSGDDGIDKAYIDITKTDDDSDDDKTYPDEDWSLDKKKGAGYTTDDEDLFDGSGSGEDDPTSDIVDVPEMTTTKTVEETTTKEPVVVPQLSPCQNLRKTAISATIAQFIPECDEEGEFKKTQCVDIGKEKQCWCVNGNGKEVLGTRMRSPDVPDCAFGNNLGGCVFQLIQNDKNYLGAYKPNCSSDGMFAPIQCQGSVCWCVDKMGNQFTGSVRPNSNKPNCDQFLHKGKTDDVKPVTSKPTTKAPIKSLPQDPDDGYNVIDNGQTPTDDIDVKIPPKIDQKHQEEQEEKTNTLGDEEKDPAPLHQDAPILAQPGLLAAIIGGAVVGLLLMVLLVMFVVYRMRKKDEGSYPLEEQKYQNYSYAKAPDKEFYA